MKGFIRVETHLQGWSEYPRLDGEALKSGELLEILYPDGITERHRVELYDSTYKGTDAGFPCTIRAKKAFITVEHHWCRLRVELVTSRLLVRRVAAKKGSDGRFQEGRGLSR